MICFLLGNRWSFDEVHFLSQLRELEKAAMEESPDIKEIVAGIISTYHIRPEDKKRDSEAFQELVSLGRISHEGRAWKRIIQLFKCSLEE